MPRTLTPLMAPDLSSFTRALGRALAARPPGDAPPGHVELMNMVARAAGHRNVQALKAAQRPAAAPVAAPVPPVPPLPTSRPTPLASSTIPATLNAHARKALQQFDPQGRLQRWPTKYSVQTLVMWVLWTQFEARRSYTEAEVNAILRPLQTYGDHVTLRRELVNHRLLARKSDCSDYRKLPARPDADTRALIAAWRSTHRPQ